MRRQHKRLIKKKRGKDKDEQECGPTFIFTTTTAVREVCVVKGNRVRERAKAEDKGNREKRKTEDDRAKESKTKMMRETVGYRRSMLLLLQAAREDVTASVSAAAAVVVIATRLDLRDLGQ